MIHLPTPTPLFNPITQPGGLRRTEIFAGPLGIIVFLPLVPLALALARRWPRVAICSTALLWIFLTLRITTGAILLGGVAAGAAWILLLTELRRRGRLGRRTGIALVWIGLHALALPLWWEAAPLWSISRMAILHSGGFAYFLLRIVAWGVDSMNDPGPRPALRDIVSWLLYAPTMRNGPVMRLQDFLTRFAAWNPRGPIAWREAGYHLLMAAGGALLLAFVTDQVPKVQKGAIDFFAAPQDYSTSALLRVFYLVPIQVYLFLWTYNEFAATCGAWLGIRIDRNFDWLPAATSVRDFWRRWHITVGSWMRDYIYIPLGGNRGFVWLNYAAVFVYCALWHGASWSFVAWGLSQALALAAQREWDRLRKRLDWQGPRGPAWTAACWLLTMHYQLATIVVFADFHFLGTRLLSELGRRVLPFGEP